MPLRSLVERAWAMARGKPGRYAMVSAVAVAVTQVTLLVSLVVVGLAAVWANIVSVSVGCIPSYLLNRYWVWGKRTRNRFLTEVLPFWVMAIVGLALSTGMVVLADRNFDHVLAIMAANLSGFGVLWVARYMILDRIMFGAVAKDPVARDAVREDGRFEVPLVEPDRARA